MNRKSIPALLTLASLAAAPSFASDRSLESAWKRVDYTGAASGKLSLPLLPGTSGFTFTMYGAPGSAAAIQELAEVMKANDLGNGFDPAGSSEAELADACRYLSQIGWPSIFYSGAEMQIKGGRAVFGEKTRAALDIMRSRPLYAAYQLGEWGYYLHNLSNNEGWLKDVYGPDFEKYRFVVKPAGLAGYEHMPASKQECYDYVKDYYTSRQNDLCGSVISVTGHSQYEAYAAEWGASCVGLELGENIGFTQCKLAFARGAARQWNKPWSVQVSPWFGPSCTSSGPLRTESGIVRGLDAGHSLSFYRRLWTHAWFAGAAMVTPENSIATAFDTPARPWNLTTYGKQMQLFFRFTRSHDRGVPYTPVAVVLDHLAGYNAYMDKPWGTLKPTAGDRQVRDLFDSQLFPGADHVHVRTEELKANPEAGYLRATPVGEIFDVLLSSATADTLSAYPVIMLAGDMEFAPGFVSALTAAAKHGSQIWLSRAHKAALGTAYPELAHSGRVVVLEEGTVGNAGRSSAISDARLLSLKALLPFEVSGDAVEYQVNRTKSGWAIELINNQGVIKKGDTPAIVDNSAMAKITLRPKFKAAHVDAWTPETKISPARNALQVRIGPGESAILEFRLR